jgi:hypothetical protein
MSAGHEAEKCTVDAMLNSPMFQRAPNLRKLVSFLWEQHAEGTTDQIKEYTIATEVLGRPPSFDQKRDAIVRVEMYRLRKRLREYFEGPGLHSKVVMHVPEGSYVPVFTARNGSVEPAPADPAIAVPEEDVWVEESPAPLPGPPQRSVSRSSWWTAVAAASLGVVLLGVLIAAALTRQSAASASGAKDGVPPAVSGPHGSRALRILAGREQGEPRTDHLGQVWLPDRYYMGGEARPNPHPRISGTFEQFLYDARREGEFQYRIPLDPGYYELRLYFAETLFGEGNLAGNGESSRIFSIAANGNTLIDSFDILADAEGPNSATVKVFKDVQPARDGKLHLLFRGYSNGRPVLNAIEILPAKKGRINPIRMVAQEEAIDDSEGRLWQPDHWVTGGMRVRRPTPPVGASEPDLYLGERYGHFTYRIPVAPGVYQLTAYFSEAWFGPTTEGGGGPGSRIFSLHCNHRPLLDSFDLFTAASGNGRALRKTFTGLKPNAQGKLVLHFQPEVNYAMINALEIEDISPVQ